MATIRISLFIYNNEEDINELVYCLKKLENQPAFKCHVSAKTLKLMSCARTWLRAIGKHKNTHTNIL